MKWELPDDPYSVDSAEACLSKRVVQKAEKHILDVEPEWSLTFSELTEWYLDRLLNAHAARRLRSIDTVKLYLNKFNRKFGDALVANITLGDLQDLQLERQAQGNKPKTIQNEMNYVKSMISEAHKHQKGGIQTRDIFERIESVYTKAEKEKNKR